MGEYEIMEEVIFKIPIIKAKNGSTPKVGKRFSFIIILCFYTINI